MEKLLSKGYIYRIAIKNMENELIRVSASIKVPVEKVWEFWTLPMHITGWYFASDDWHAPYAENNIFPGGRFKTTMAAKDGSMSFDFEGTYNKVEEFREIEYILDDNRKVFISFGSEGGETSVTEDFEPETVYPKEMQKTGWQSILDNFRSYCETYKK